MPGSDLGFQDVYTPLLNNEHHAVPGLHSPEDALLLLVAILSDAIYVRGSLEHLTSARPSVRQPKDRANPFIPFSADSERVRMERLLVRALGRWKDAYYEKSPADVQTFYHYCMLFMSYSEMFSLLSVVKRLEQDADSRMNSTAVPSEKSVRTAWLVLDAACRRNLESPGTLCPIWLPIMVYHGALIVWAHHYLGEPSAGTTRSAARMLLPFEQELGGMHWPCCYSFRAMVSRLGGTYRHVQAEETLLREQRTTHASTKGVLLSE
jgi:hypothetical protein